MDNQPTLDSLQKLRDRFDRKIPIPTDATSLHKAKLYDDSPIKAQTLGGKCRTENDLNRIPKRK